MFLVDDTVLRIAGWSWGLGVVAPVTVTAVTVTENVLLGVLLLMILRPNRFHIFSLMTATSVVWVISILSLIEDVGYIFGYIGIFGSFIVTTFVFFEEIEIKGKLIEQRRFGIRIWSAFIHDEKTKFKYRSYFSDADALEIISKGKKIGTILLSNYSNEDINVLKEFLQLR